MIIIIMTMMMILIIIIITIITIMITIILLSFDHGVFFLSNIFGKRSDLPFSLESDRNNEKSLVSFTHEHNIICSQTKLDDIAPEQTIICR